MFRLLLAASEVRQTLTEAPPAWYDLSVALGGASAAAWIAWGSDPHLGVGRVLGLFDLPPEAFAPLAHQDLVDAVTLTQLAGAHAFRLNPRTLLR